MLWLYRFFNVLSIDVAVGAVVCAAFFVHIFQIQLPLYCLPALGVSVWIIYSVDHLLDTHKLKGRVSTKRRQFHYKNIRVIGAGVIMAIASDLLLILNIGKPILIWGTGLLLMILLYIWFQRLLGPFKEFFGALLYSFGVLLPVLALHSTPIPASHILLMSAFSMTALINLVLFSWFDLAHDKKDTQVSVVIILGRRKSTILLMGLFIFQLILFIALLSATPWKGETLILMVMNLVLLLIFCFSDWFMTEDYYRLAGDVIFLFPLPYLLLNG